MDARAWLRRSLPYLVVAAAGFLIAYLAIFLFAFPARIVPDDAILPNVVGIPFDAAQADLENAGFHAQQGETRYSKVIREGVVLQEDPPAGSRQKRGTDVVLAVSAGQKTAEVPDLVNMTQADAKVAIENTGLTLGNVLEKLSDQQRGYVVASDPPAGAKLELPAKVNILISLGPAQVAVPDVTGRSLGEARSIIEQAGLHVAGISRDTSSIQPENTVLGQIPAAGQTTANGGPVSLRISRFPPVSTRPDSIRLAPL